MSEMRKIDEKVDDGRRASTWVNSQSVNPSNLNFSIAMVQSVYPDRQTCDILIVAKNTFRQAIPSVIPIQVLNIIGHFKHGDYVLISHKGDGMNCRIVQKLQDTNKTISNDPEFKKNSGSINFGVMTA